MKNLGNPWHVIFTEFFTDTTLGAIFVIFKDEFYEIFVPTVVQAPELNDSASSRLR